MILFNIHIYPTYIINHFFVYKDINKMMDPNRIIYPDVILSILRILF